MTPIITFSVTADEHRTLDTAAAEHALSASQWVKAAAIELATTIATNRANRTARRTARNATK